MMIPVPFTTCNPIWRFRAGLWNRSHQPRPITHSQLLINHCVLLQLGVPEPTIVAMTHPPMPGTHDQPARGSRSRPVVLAALACLLAASGCSDDAAPGGDALPPSSGTTSLTTPGPAASVSPGTGASTSDPSAAATTVEPAVESTADRSVAPPADLVRVVAVRVEETDGREQVVVETEGGTPGYRVRYVDAVRIDGEPVLIDGSVFLELVLQQAEPAGEQGLDDAVAVDLHPGLGLVEQVQLAYYLGAELTYAIGLSSTAPFTVETTDEQITITFGP